MKNYIIFYGFIILFLISCRPGSNHGYSALRNYGIIEEYDKDGNLIKQTIERNSQFDKEVVGYDKAKKVKFNVYYVDDLYYSIDQYSSGKLFFSHGIVNKNHELSLNGYATFIGNHINYYDSEFAYLKPSFTDENGICKCFLNIIYFTTAIPALNYILLYSSISENLFTPDTLYFDKKMPVTKNKPFKGDNLFSTFGLWRLSEIYPCYYTKTIELKNLNSDTIFISGSVNAFYYAEILPKGDTSVYCRQLNFKSKIFKFNAREP